MPVEPSQPRSPLVDVVLATWVAGLVYGTLYPWSGWRWVGVPGLGFLLEPWPRWWTWFDVLVNVAVYALPCALAAALLRRRVPAAAAALLAAVAGSLLSLALESLQSFLPGRVPSRLDWAANTVGAIAGGLLGACWPRAGRHAGALRWLTGAATTHSAAWGLVVIGVWVLVQAHPQRLLFGVGDVLEPLLAMLATDPVSASSSAWVPGLPEQVRSLAVSLRLDPDHAVLAEAAGAACAIVAIGMLVRELYPPHAPRAAITAGVVGAALAVRAASSALLLDPGRGMAWLTAGAQGGMVIGAIALALLASARRRSRLLIGAAAVASAALLTNASPVDAYHATMLARWDAGAWRNFNGLVHAAAALWPAAAIAWCLARIRGLRDGRAL
jgi:hypothetical protein